jgi:hypothetical protein
MAEQHEIVVCADIGSIVGSTIGSTIGSIAGSIVARRLSQPPASSLQHFRIGGSMEGLIT